MKYMIMKQLCGAYEYHMEQQRYEREDTTRVDLPLYTLQSAVDFEYAAAKYRPSVSALSIQMHTKILA